MAHFSNGTEGMMYEEHYCSRCIHRGDEEHGCAVWMVHLVYAYGAKGDVAEILERLIPTRKDGFAGKCKMFAEERKPVEQRGLSGLPLFKGEGL